MVTNFIQIAHEPKANCLYNLDRISDLRPTDDVFTAPADFDATSYYADSFGITRPHDQVAQEVILRLTPTQGRYVLGHPLHPSQRVLFTNANEIQLTLHVYITRDLYMELLSYGGEVEVLAPTSLRDWLRTGHAEAVGP